MKLRNILNNLLLESDSFKLKKIDEDGGYIQYDIYQNADKVGYLNVDLDRNNLKIDSIFIEPKFRNSGIGTKLLQNSVKILKKKHNFKYITYYAVSVQSGKVALKAFGTPIKINTTFGNYDSFEEAAERFGLPQTASVDSDGTIIAGESDAVLLIFDS